MNKSQLRILNAEALNFNADARAVLQTVGELTEAQLDRGGLIRSIPGYHVLITRLGHQIDAEVMNAALGLRVIVTAATGLDHIDLNEAKSKGIEVLSLRGEHEFLAGVSATAEHTWALLLALVRKVPAAFDHIRRGDWQRDQFVGRTLANRKLGVVGYGRLGRMVASYGRAFGMEVLVTDVAAANDLEPQLRRCSLDELLAGSDIVTLHVPLEERTRNLIGPDELAKLVRGSFLVNTSRGEIVNSIALLDALESGQLAGAALDVLADERPGKGTMSSHPLVRYAKTHSNLLITPHIGGATADSMRQTEVFMAEKLRRWAQSGGYPNSRSRS
jgi:D-3-phosphoglycerate dehydrogenase